VVWFGVGAACPGWLTRTVSAHISWWPWAASPTRWVMNLVLGDLVWCKSCLHWLADKDSLRSHILVAMGSLAYKVGNESESGSGWFGLV
jgi:hypothetical protein